MIFEWIICYTHKSLFCWAHDQLSVSVQSSEHKCGNEIIWFEELNSNIANFLAANVPNVNAHNTRNPMSKVNLPSF